MASDAVPIHPQRFAREIRDFLDRDAIVVGDGGDIVGITASIVQAYQPGHWLDPGPFGCLGVGPSFAIAAKLAKPDKQVLIVYGDGSFGFNAMEYESALRQDIPFVGIIGNDGAWGQIKVAQEALYGPGNAPAANLDPEAPYHRDGRGPRWLRRAGGGAVRHPARPWNGRSPPGWRHASTCRSIRR